jgi:hypothetical protein
MKELNLKDLEQLGLQSLKDFWGLENGAVESLDHKQVNVLIHKARLGMQFYREFNVHSRSIERNTFRICTLLAEDKKELRKMLKSSLPQYVIGK